MIGDAFSYIFTSSNWSGSVGMLVELEQQLLLTVTALALAMLVGLPIALVLGHLGRGGFLAINVSNIGRAVPTFAVLILLSVGPLGTGVLGPYGRAGLATLVSLTLFALPPIITNSYVGMREVDRNTVEAATGMGMKGSQLFASVELPLAMPLVLTGLRLALVQVWATATIAALVAGPGLGNVITAGFQNSDYGKGLAGAIVVAAVALVLEGTAALVERFANPLARAERREAATVAVA
ncbi:MAG: osmoprotectant transport system permease protein [Nocardioidaceae bacterium]|jgi:osmoprotectant transport system permease protein|nr:osmoprotectant transport system permease protein [Nocardioidaceae bacterium]